MVEEQAFGEAWVGIYNSNGPFVLKQVERMSTGEVNAQGEIVRREIEYGKVGNLLSHNSGLGLRPRMHLGTPLHSVQDLIREHRDLEGVNC